MSNWNLNDTAPITVGQDFSPAATPWSQQFWGSPAMVVPAQIGGNILNGQSVVSCSGVASVVGHVVKTGAAIVGGVATVVTQAEMKFKGVANANVLANAAVVGKLFLGGRFSIACALTALLTPRKVQRSVAPVEIQALALVGAGMRAGGMIINLAQTVAVANAQSVLDSLMEASIIFSALAGGNVISALSNIISEAVNKGTSPKPLMGKGNKVFKTVWRDRMPDRKKRARVAATRDDE